MSKPHLRPVADGEVAPLKPKILTLPEAVADGDYLEILRAQRRDIVTSLDGEKGPALAALHRQLSLLSKEIATLEQQLVTEEPDAAHRSGDDTFDASAI